MEVIAKLKLGYHFFGPPGITKPPRLTQHGHPSAGNEYWQRLRPPLGKKRRALRNIRPCYQDCLHTDPVSLLKDAGC